MKNNIKALILHLITVVISFILLVIFVATAPKFGKYTTNILSRLFLTVSLIRFYVYMGTFLDINKDRKYDFYVGGIISIIGIGLWLYTFLMTNGSLIEVPKEVSTYWILFNSYYMPFTMIDFLLGIQHIPLLSLLNIFMPSLFMGFGLRYKRVRIEKK
jgi:hypothetical protein